MDWDWERGRGWEGSTIHTLNDWMPFLSKCAQADTQSASFTRIIIIIIIERFNVA